MQQKLIKVISALLATTILYANSTALISYAADNFLSDNELESQGTSTNNENVEFDAYFVNGKTKTHEIESNIGEGSSIYLSIAVKNAGYLKNVPKFYFYLLKPCTSFDTVLFFAFYIYHICFLYFYSL